MGGVIVVAEATSWSAASWLVRWLFRTLVDDTDQPDLATKLRHPEETGFLYFSLSELPDTQRSEVVHLILKQAFSVYALSGSGPKASRRAWWTAERHQPGVTRGCQRRPCLFFL
jgi:hypothetical protein